MLKLTVFGKAVAKVEVETTEECFDEEDGEYYESTELVEEEVECPFPPNYVIDMDNVWGKEFCEMCFRKPVESAKLYFEQIGFGKFYAFCELTLDLTLAELEVIKQDLINEVQGQFSDGIGEGFEQHPYKYDGVDFYLSAWYEGQKLESIVELL